MFDDKKNWAIIWGVLIITPLVAMAILTIMKG